MAEPNKVQVVSAANVAWDSGDTFDGYALFLLAMPTSGGVAYTKAFLKADDIRAIRLPVRQKWPVINGVLEPQLRLWRNDSITPPNTKYCVRWYDTTGTFIAGGPSLVAITTGSSYTVTPPTLTAPTAAAACPTPESQAIPGTAAAVSLIPSIVDLTGSKPGTSFTIPGGTLALVEGLFWNGLRMEESVGYTRSGNAVTMTDTVGAGDSLEAVVWYA